MSQPDALLEYALASTAAHVVSKAFVESVGEDYGTPGVGSIGTGPFKFVEWVSGDHQTLARNDDYWDKANGGPYLDEITIKILPEPTTRVAGLETGEIDYLVNNVPSDQYETVKGFDNVSLTFVPSFYGEWITFNTQLPPFDNVKVRQAMNYALDKAGLRALYRPDSPDTKATLVYPTMWTFEKDAWQAAWDALPAYDQDLEKAAQLLEESGVADQLNGMTISYYESTPSIKGIAESFIDAMSQLGITIEANKTTYQENIAQQFGDHDDYDIFVGSWGSDFPDPSGNLRPNFGSENIVAGGANASAYSNAGRRRPAPGAEHADGQGRASPAPHRGAGHHRRGVAAHLGDATPAGHWPSTSASRGPRSARCGTGRRSSRTSGSPSSHLQPRTTGSAGRARWCHTSDREGSPHRHGRLRRTPPAGRHPHPALRLVRHLRARPAGAGRPGPHRPGRQAHQPRAHRAAAREVRPRRRPHHAVRGLARTRRAVRLR